MALELALRLAAPAALALTLAGLALALIARAAPAFPFWSLALPVRSFVGLAAGPGGPHHPGGDPGGDMGRLADGTLAR